MNGAEPTTRFARGAGALAAIALACFAIALPARAILAGELILAPPGAEAAFDERFLDGLRSRGLFDLAEKYCRDRLARTDLSDTQRMDTTIELARILTARAIESPASARGPLARAAESVIDGLLQTRSGDSRALPLALQRAMVSLSLGELGRQEAEVGGLSSPTLEPARAALRDAVSQLKLFDQRVAIELQRHSRSPRAQPGEWTTSELLSLAMNGRFQLARAYRNQALTYLPDSSDRINSLTAANSLLKPLAGLPPTTPLAWDSRIDEIICLRLLRDTPSADRALAAAFEADPPAEVRRRLEAESIREHLAAADIAGALEMVAALKPPAASDGPELSLARLEALAAACGPKSQATVTVKETYRQAAAEQTRFITQSFGAYWMRRAETLVAGTIAADPNTQNIDTLRQAAAAYFRGGRLGESLAAYDRVARVARESGAADQAFDAAFMAASIEQQQSNWRAAVDRFRDLARAFPTHARADIAHLLAAYGAAQLAEHSEGAERRAAGDEYNSLLEEQLKLWPTSPTIGQAAWWLGQSRESAKQYEAAIEAYRQIPPGHARFLPALAATARALRSALAAKRAESTHDARAFASEGARYFASWTTAQRPTVVERPATAAPPAGAAAEKAVDMSPAEIWALVQRQAALWAAEFYLEAGGDGPAKAVEVLNAAIAQVERENLPANEALTAWRSAVDRLRVVALAGAGREAEAAQLLAALGGSTPQSMLALCETLARDAEAAPAAARAIPARLELRALDALAARQATLSPEERRRVDLMRSQALADSGQFAEGLALLERLASEHPTDGSLQESLAELLGAGGRDERKRALHKWREVQQKSRPGSPRWFRAGYGLAHAQLALGNKIAAAAAVRVVAKAYPALGGEAMKARFDTLLAECEENAH